MGRAEQGSDKRVSAGLCGRREDYAEADKRNCPPTPFIFYILIVDKQNPILHNRYIEAKDTDMQLTPQVISPQKGVIGHNAKAKLLLADISDLGLRRFERLYDDACDVGFALRNPETGNITRWSLLDEIRDPRENELLGWMLVPTFETLNKQPELRGYQFNIVND